MGVTFPPDPLSLITWVFHFPEINSDFYQWILRWWFAKWYFFISFFDLKSEIFRLSRETNHSLGNKAQIYLRYRWAFVKKFRKIYSIIALGMQHLHKENVIHRYDDMHIRRQKCHFWHVSEILQPEIYCYPDISSVKWEILDCHVRQKRLTLLQQRSHPSVRSNGWRQRVRFHRNFVELSRVLMCTAMKDKQYSQATDVFSYGYIFWFCELYSLLHLTGEFPREKYCDIFWHIWLCTVSLYGKSWRKKSLGKNIRT